ncbi:ABC transporter ATP-binding protein [soil metagenome]
MRQRYSTTEGSETLAKPTWPAVKRLIALAAPHKAILSAGAVLMLLSTGISLSLPLLGRDAINRVTATKDVQGLDSAVAIILGLVVLSAILSFGQFMIGALAGNRIVMDLRLKLFEHLQNLPVSFFDKTRSGDLSSHLSNDVTQIQGTLTDDLVKLTSQVVTLVGGIFILIKVDWRLTLIVISLLAVVMVYFVVFGRRLRKLNRDALDALSDAMGAITEALANIRLVKAFSRQTFEHDRASVKMGKVLTLNMKSAVSEGTMGAIGGSGFAFLMLGVIWYGGHRVLEGTLQLGDLFAFFLSLMIIGGPMGQLASLYTRLQRSVGAADRLFELLDESPEVPDPVSAVDFPFGVGEVVFQDVSFAYGAGASVLDHLNLTLPAGKVTALVGPSGAGKTTVSSLLYRFYEPKSGSISIDGVAIDHVKRTSLRENIGIVPQEPVLFNGTLRENIRYGRLNATDEEIAVAALDANVAEFVASMPDGYDTMIGERGITLSGGQRQRVAIARAVLKDPRILILDEATSALDNKSEALVKDALDRLMKGRTTLIIAHRLSTVQGADQIAVLADGKIVETGTHDDLIGKGGRYAELYELVN